MSFAIVGPDGFIKDVVRKLSPATQLPEQDRIVHYNPPSLDTEMYTAAPDMPVPPEADSVTFTTVPRPTEIAWTVVRRRRNEKLRDSDWTQMPDNGIEPTKKQEWVAYRQKLRDITKEQAPHSIIWPTPPD